MGISALKSMKPPNVGVVAPLCKQGNTNIFTHDMVHRTHIDIFGWYYPPKFDNWYIDDWITKVYQPNRSKLIKDWEVYHEVKMTRYSPKKGNLLSGELRKGKEKLNEWLVKNDDLINHSFKQELIVMATFSNRVDVITVSNQYNQIYAHHHGYVRIVSNNRILPNSPAPWEKIPMISQLLANLSIGVVFWIDDDAFVKKSEIKVQDWLDLYAGADLIIGNQDAINQGQFSINSGVMIIKNTKWSRSFFNSLMKNPNCDYTSRSCCWEQDCMRKVLSLPNKHVALVPLGKFNCWGHHKSYAGRCDPWVYHVMGQGIDKASEMKILAQSINTLEKRSQKNKLFQIHILTMNRFHSLTRLLTSLENSIYNGDRVELHIHIDKSEKSKECIKVAQSFQFSHGLVNITVSKTKLGLRDAWLNAWNVDENERAIILEDDIELSVNWYSWLQKAWNTYKNRTDLAGISLERQTLIPQKPSKHREILNNNIPFLYKLVGSHGFSPHPNQWKGFLSWVKLKNLDTYDAKVDGLITSDWYNTLDKKSMWEQLFIKYCNLKSLYTLYVTLPERKTLAAHWREKGEHFNGPAKIDFELSKTINFEFPKYPAKYGWDGELIKPTLVIMGTAQNVGKYSASNVATIKRIAKDFKILSVIIFENDSTDNTLSQLLSWKDKLGVKVEIISENGVIGSRTVRLAHGRNKLWNTVHSMSKSPDYVLMLDLDGVNKNLEGVMTCMTLPNEWGGCCANQRTTYYDLWALRTYDSWVNCDVWYECTANRRQRFRHIDSNASPIKVQSCFGGAALYKYAKVNPNAAYIGSFNGHEKCEHVEFHAQIGASMYIQPAMLNDAPVEHIPKL